MAGFSFSFVELQKVDSTNLYAERLVTSGKVGEGTIICAEEQTSGKGQGENQWISEPGKNATFSIVLFPGFLLPGEQFLLNEAISMGVLDFLKGTQIRTAFSIKWPNDIYAGLRKIGGILIRNNICGNRFEWSIAGIGLNINQESFPQDLPNPVSMALLSGEEYPVKDTIRRIAERIEARYLELKEGLTGQLNHEYQEHLLGINSWKKYLADKMEILGAIRGVDESGMLILEMENGSVRKFNHGEIEWRW